MRRPEREPGNHLPRRGASDIGGHDHRPQGPIHPPTRFEQRREERTLSDFRDPQLHVSRWGRQHPSTSAIALVRPGLGSFVPLGADGLSQLGVDQLLERLLHQVTEQERDLVTAKLRNQLSQSGIMALSHRVSPFESTADELTEDSTVAPSDHGPSYTTRWDAYRADQL